jgi:hypothetical protein
LERAVLKQYFRQVSMQPLTFNVSPSSHNNASSAPSTARKPNISLSSSIYSVKTYVLLEYISRLHMLVLSSVAKGALFILG